MFNRTLPFTAGYALLFVVMASMLMCYPKGELHILLNSVHTHIEDLFFKYFTVCAEWPLYVIGLLPLLFRKMWWVVFYAASEGVGAIVVTALKHIFRMPRPLTFFNDDINSYLPVVDGVKLHHTLSFPSGHTSTFFVFITVCVILLALHRKERMKLDAKGSMFVASQIALLLIAALGGYSRIYLSQHFLLDVFAGSIIGIAVPFALFPLFALKLKQLKDSRTSSSLNQKSRSQQTAS